MVSLIEPVPSNGDQVSLSRTLPYTVDVIRTSDLLVLGHDDFPYIEIVSHVFAKKGGT